MKKVLVEDFDTHVVEQDIKTTSYMLFYLEYDKIKSVGDLDLKGIAPLLMRLAMEKFTKGG